MEDLHTSSHPAIDTMPMHPRKKRTIIIVSAVVGVIILAVIGYYIWKKHHTVKVIATPAQTLEDLRLQSAPDKATIAQKSATMNALEKNAKPVTLTHQQQLDMLNKLGK